jgi:hypothetical protein
MNSKSCRRRATKCSAALASLLGSAAVVVGSAVAAELEIGSWGWKVDRWRWLADSDESGPVAAAVAVGCGGKRSSRR